MGYFRTVWERLDGGWKIVYFMTLVMQSLCNHCAIIVQSIELGGELGVGGGRLEGGGWPMERWRGEKWREKRGESEKARRREDEKTSGGFDGLWDCLTV